MTAESDNAALESKLSRIVGAYAARPDTSAVEFAITSPTRSWRWAWSSPDLARQYFMASATKLYVTALMMQLRAEGLVELGEPAARYLGASVMAGIHVLKGVDYSDRVTVLQLLSHTSGIGDYFEQRRGDGTTTIGRALQQDFSWTFDDVLRISKQDVTPRFAPSTPGKAFYSDTNYQLLGRIIEESSGLTYEEALQQRIIGPLDLRDTYPFTSASMERYDSVAPMLYGRQVVRIPKVMASVRADGGIVSTADDGIRFLDAFMNGRLFPVEYLDEMCEQWRAIFPPLEYGVGIMRFSLPRYYTLLKAVPPMIGHSGASGAVLYHVPALDLYISGTVNQIKKRSLSYNAMTRLVDGVPGRVGLCRRGAATDAYRPVAGLSGAGAWRRWRKMCSRRRRRSSSKYSRITTASGRQAASRRAWTATSCRRACDRWIPKKWLSSKGVRRCGKSTLMAQIIRALMAREEKPTAILRVNLEEPLFSSEYGTDLLEQIYRLWRERVQPDGRCLLFLDEVQNIPSWERWVRGRTDTEDLKVFVTGSSSPVALPRGRHKAHRQAGVLRGISPLVSRVSPFQGDGGDRPPGVWNRQGCHSPALCRLSPIRRLPRGGPQGSGGRQGIAAEELLRGSALPGHSGSPRSAGCGEPAESGSVPSDEYRPRHQHQQAEEELLHLPGQDGSTTCRPSWKAVCFPGCRCSPTP